MNKKIFGFWIYLMSDLILFSVLFTVYIFMSDNVYLGPSIKDIINIKYIFIESLILFLSTFFCGNILIFINKSIIKTIVWLSFTFLFGLLFLLMEINEFFNLFKNGYTPNVSCFLSAFYMLIWTHGLHVIFGLIWIISLILYLFKNGLTFNNFIRIKCFTLFWHFLDIIWIILFTIVYLLKIYN